MAAHSLQAQVHAQQQAQQQQQQPSLTGYRQPPIMSPTVAPNANQLSFQPVMNQVSPHTNAQQPPGGAGQQQLQQPPQQQQQQPPPPASTPLSHHTNTYTLVSNAPTLQQQQQQQQPAIPPQPGTYNGQQIHIYVSCFADQVHQVLVN
jgi:hypothetical protein